MTIHTADDPADDPTASGTAPDDTLDVGSAEGADGEDSEVANDKHQGDTARASRTPMPPQRLALVMGLLAAVTMAALASWLGYQARQTHQASEQRQLFVQVGRQGALNLTTIDWQHADADTKRILDSATGTFYDEFSQRSQPFIDVVNKMKSKSVGTITEAGLESQSHDTAQVLVAVSVKTTVGDGPEQEPRAWRMRVTVQKVGNDVKVADVEFVS
ncbi:Mce protein [Mycolicibacterium gadium]|uniref:Mce protein n=1 Tax=Mycolicibacterium gadium TaxID=1794 RepID=A0ABT6GTW7_MYCGU|nr:Mce protein [Mycolicibacterium gadium]MDG5484677.1 Mce protein [Mycolicibacterium gadium]